jgi:hypothetical protein
MRHRCLYCHNTYASQGGLTNHQHSCRVLKAQERDMYRKRERREAAGRTRALISAAVAEERARAAEERARAAEERLRDVKHAVESRVQHVHVDARSVVINPPPPEKERFVAAISDCWERAKVLTVFNPGMVVHDFLYLVQQSEAAAFYIQRRHDERWNLDMYRDLGDLAVELGDADAKAKLVALYGEGVYAADLTPDHFTSALVKRAAISGPLVEEVD